MSEPQLFEDYNDLEAPPFAHPGSAFDGMLNATPDRGFQPPHDSPLSSWNRDRTTPSRSAPGALHKHANPLRSRVHMRLDMSGAGQPERYRTPPEAELGEVETPAGVLAGFPAGLQPSSSFEAQHLRESGADVPMPAAAAPGAFTATPAVSSELQQQLQQQQQERSPQRHTWVPHGLDAASYAAGQKAATLAAFHKLLPAHQAIGQVLAAVEGLGGRLEGEAAQWRALQLQQSKTAAMVETTIQRLDTLDYMRIPQLQEKCEEAAGRGPNAAVEIADALHSLQQVLTALCAQQQLLLHLQQQQQQHGGPAGPASCSLGLHLWRLLCAAVGYAQQALSKADVAALFLSRKILLAEVPAPRSRAWGLAQRGTAAVLFIAAVEGLWHAHKAAAARRQLGEGAREVLRPLGLALRVARTAVWCSAAVLGVAGLKAACSATAEASCQAVGRLALLRLQLPRLRGLPRGGQRPRGSAGEQQGGGGTPAQHPGAF